MKESRPRTRAKTALLSFPVKQDVLDADETRNQKVNKPSQGAPDHNQPVFRLEDILPSVQDPGARTVDTRPRTLATSMLASLNIQVKNLDSTAKHLTRRKPGTSARVLDFPSEGLRNVRHNFGSDASSWHPSSSAALASLPPPVLNPKLKLLKSQAQTPGLIPNSVLNQHPLKKINSLLAPMNFSTSRKLSQFSPTTTASYRYALTKSATQHARPGTSLNDLPPSANQSQQLGQLLPVPSPSSSVSSKSKRSKSSHAHTPSQKSAENELTKPQSSTLVATTTEVELLKLTPRDPSTIKSGMFIIDNPAKISNPSLTKKYHICRSLEERERNPETIYLDKLNLKHFPSIDSTETQLRLLSLQHNLIHRIDNNNLTIQPNLLVLDLYNNRIDRISGLHIFSSLKVLLLGKNRIRRIEGLDMLKHLEILDLHGNQLRYLDNINSLMSLRVLNVAGNVIRSIRNFGPYGISSLQELNLKRNQIQNLTGILKITHLKKLSLGNNNIQSVSTLLPLKKLDLLQELQLEPNPICDLPDYESQILALLPKLLLLDVAAVTEDMKHGAEVWCRKKLAEEHERRREQEKIKFLSTTASRDEVIHKARKRWESLRNYVKQNSIGSGKFAVHKEASVEERLVRQNAIIDSDMTHSFADEGESKFTVELELDAEEQKAEVESLEESKSMELIEPSAEPAVVEILPSTAEIAAQNEPTELCASKTAPKPQESADLLTSNTLASHVSTAENSPVSSLPVRPPAKVIAIVKPSIRQPVDECIQLSPSPASLRKIPLLMNTMKSTGQSIIEEDEEEDLRSESIRMSSEYTANEEHTLLGSERSQSESQNAETGSTPINAGTDDSQLRKNEDDGFLGPPLMQPPTLKLPGRRPILRRSTSQFTLSLPRENQAHVPRKPVPKITVSQNKHRKPLSRSKSIADLSNQVLNDNDNDSDTPSDIESVTTINTTSDTGSGTTSNATPRKYTGRPKLVRSSSTRNLLKPRGKTARHTNASASPSFGTAANQKRPLTSVPPNSNSNMNVVKTETLRPILRRSESAINLHTAPFTTVPEVVVKKQGVDYLVEMNDKLLNIYGQGALKHMLTAFSSNSTGNITMVTFHFVTFDSIIPYFGKMRQIYPALEHFHFRANGLTCLSQLNTLADLQGITSLYVHQDGNPLFENSLWKEYAVYRLGHWGLQQVNGTDVSSYGSLPSLGPPTKGNGNEKVKTFDSLGYLALSCLPQSALTPLAERLHMLQCFCCCSTSNSSEDSGKKRSDGPSIGATCTSYWDDDPVLLDVIGKEALVYVPQIESSSGSRDTVTEIFDSGCEIIQKLAKLEQTWPTLMVDAIEDILLDYQVMDNFMKKELIGLKNSLSANSPSSNARRKAKF